MFAPCTSYSSASIGHPTGRCLAEPPDDYSTSCLCSDLRVPPTVPPSEIFLLYRRKRCSFREGGVTAFQSSSGLGPGHDVLNRLRPAHTRRATAKPREREPTQIPRRGSSEITGAMLLGDASTDCSLLATACFSLGGEDRLDLTQRLVVLAVAAVELLGGFIHAC